MKDFVGFSLFVVVWNRAQGQDTPELHLRIADWLEAMRERGRTRLLLQAFRSGGKSTIVGLFAAWLLYRDANLRILVLAADLMLARKMVRNVKRIVERHPLTAHLRPQHADQWGADRFTVSRALELRDPSMLAKGIGANMTGSRADVIICDDVEVPNTCDTAEKRADLRERLAETGFVLVPGGTLLYAGTPHSWYTIYAAEPRREIGEEAPFLDGFRRLTIPVIDADGNSAWPERFRREDIERLERASGPARFKSQMLLQPVNIAEGRLDPACFVRYAAEPDYLREINLLQLGDRKIVSASAWWDPAFGAAGGDGSVLAIVYTDELGHHWLHRLCYLNRRHDESGEDEATRQCRAVALLAREFHLPSVAVEINGLGRFLPGVLRRELARAKVTCAVVEISSRRPKDLRIMEAFDAALAARTLHVHDSVYATGFIAEVQEWRPGLKNARDDGLDAVAGALSREPVRIGRLYHSGPGPGWRQGAGQFTAKTEFDVS
jgi:hypothetical protein